MVKLRTALASAGRGSTVAAVSVPPEEAEAAVAPPATPGEAGLAPPRGLNPPGRWMPPPPPPPRWCCCSFCCATCSCLWRAYRRSAWCDAGTRRTEPHSRAALGRTAAAGMASSSSETSATCVGWGRARKSKEKRTPGRWTDSSDMASSSVGCRGILPRPCWPTLGPPEPLLPVSSCTTGSLSRDEMPDPDPEPWTLDPTEAAVREAPVLTTEDANRDPPMPPPGAAAEVDATTDPLRLPGLRPAAPLLLAWLP
mmetsp:Transcript_16850/g.48407  ORF Transcript_16850/g.48407 Transcript_16850/m.48407 type:complete len:254 (+) Transcript_16850:3466-4227(+)